MLYRGDCLDVLPTMVEASVDMVCADPPYGTTACKWDSIIPLGPLWEQLRRVLKPRGAVVLTASQPFTTTLVGSNRAWFRHEWVWHKTHGGGFLNANRAPLKRHESVLVFSARQPPYRPLKTSGKPYSCRRAAAGGTTRDQSVAGWVTRNDGDRYPTSVLAFPNEVGLHPTQKPVALMEYLVRTYTEQGDSVLDFCMGSGTTGVACERAGRAFVGIERDPAYFAVAERRVAEALSLAGAA